MGEWESGSPILPLPHSPILPYSHTSPPVQFENRDVVGQSHSLCRQAPLLLPNLKKQLRQRAALRSPRYATGIFASSG